MTKMKSKKPSGQSKSSTSYTSRAKSNSQPSKSKSSYRSNTKTSSVKRPSKPTSSNRKSSITSGSSKSRKSTSPAGSSKARTSGQGKHKSEKRRKTGSQGGIRSSFSRLSGGGSYGAASKSSSFPYIPVLFVVLVLILIVVLFTLVFKRNPDEGESVSINPTDTITVTDSLSAEDDQTSDLGDADKGTMPEDPEKRNGMYTSPPTMSIDQDKTYIATMDTEKGEIVIELFADKVPFTVNNFVFLARAGYYDNTTFHRVLADFMAQAGDPAGLGTGGPGYTFQDEFHADLSHDTAGVLSMANAGANTNGSQFFLTFAPTPWLDGHHTVFGKVVKGLDVLLSITLRDPQFATEPGDSIHTISISESEVSLLPTPTPVAYVQPGEIAMPEQPEARNGMYAGKIPAMVIDPDKSYGAILETENGIITIELYADKVPNTVNNFVFLAREGFYNNTTFHRVIEDFMAQAGDPAGVGSGGPGYAFADEINTDLRHDDAGIFSMANAGANTNGSQFFITFDATPWLDGAHTVFGKITDGFDVLEKINLRDPQTASTQGDIIISIEIVEN